MRLPRICQMWAGLCHCNFCWYLMMYLVSFAVIRAYKWMCTRDIFELDYNTIPRANKKGHF